MNQGGRGEPAALFLWLKKDIDYGKQAESA